MKYRKGRVAAFEKVPLTKVEKVKEQYWRLIQSIHTGLKNGPKAANMGI